MSSTKDDKSRLERAPYKPTKDFDVTYKGQCFCGAIKFEVHGDPKANCFCHCRSCQRLHGAPASLTSIYDKENVQFTEGYKDDMVFYSPQEKKSEYKLPLKISCKHCHSPIANEGNNMVLILPALIDFDHGADGRLPKSFRPTFHQYYETRIRDIEDDLPKFNAEKNNEPLNAPAEAAVKEAQKTDKKKEEEKNAEDLKERTSKRQKTSK